MAVSSTFPSSLRIVSSLSRSFRDCSLKCAAFLSGVRYYRGSARDTKRREWNKRMAEIRKEKPKKFDYKQFILTYYDKELFAFAHRLRLNPDNILLRRAFIHKSCITGNEADVAEHNGKLAVLGFNVTTKFIGEFLFFQYTHFPSSGLRCLQDYLLSRAVLVKVARSLSIPELIQTPFDLDSPEEIPEKNITKEDIISDSLLALIGAIYLEEGSASARAFVRDFIIVELNGREMESIIPFKNPEITLAALLEQQRREKPIARVITSSGKSTDTPAYVVGIFSSEILLAKATSPILQKAKQEAYCAALTTLLKSSFLRPPKLPSDKEIEIT